MKVLKNVWNLCVNVGWLVIMGYLLYPYVYEKYQKSVVSKVVEVQSPSTTLETTPINEPKPKTQNLVANNVVPPPQENPQVEMAVQEDLTIEENTKSPLAIGFDRPTKQVKADELIVDDTLQVQELVGKVNIDLPKDFPPWRVDPAPNVICQGGSCEIDPRYKFTSNDARTGPEPKIFFPPTIQPGYELPAHSRARYENEELRSELNSLKHRVKWTPRFFKLLDLSKVGGCPTPYQSILSQNKQLVWRIRQINLILQGYAPEGAIDDPSH